MNRELNDYYIALTDLEINEMLKVLNLKSLDDLFLENEFKHEGSIIERVNYHNLLPHLEKIAKKNKLLPSFIGDALTDFKVSTIVDRVSSIRGLYTAYTPYQPEGSQGTLISLFLYSSLMHKITGFEAISSSLYDRSTAIFEAITTAIRVSHKTKFLYANILPQDLNVIKTFIKERDIELIEIDSKDGIIDQDDLKSKLNSEIAAVIFNQVNNLGLLEDVDTISSLTKSNNSLVITVIDPIIATYLKSLETNADIIVGEGQNLASPPSFGGPGLGIFGVRFNESTKNFIRNTPGRFVGKTKDAKGNDAYCMVLSTREQHIRREKATSNICSNQSFMATLAAANLLVMGADYPKIVELSHLQLVAFLQDILQLEGVDLAYPTTPFLNQVVLKTNQDANYLIDEAFKKGVYLGVSLSDRLSPNHLLISFFNQTDAAIKKLTKFFYLFFPIDPSKKVTIPSIRKSFLRESFTFPKFEEDIVFNYFEKLGNLNFSPDDFLYPLGSCTMKYNPLVNDAAANIDEFKFIHPQAPLKGIQGNLEILYLIQEAFCKITGLPYVATQPVAGAQGELLGIKLFQAYMKSRNENRKTVIIPKSAHGTNPATAAMAGCNVVIVNENDDALIDLNHLDELISIHGNDILGIMVTNPNTCGILESNFKVIADKIHAINGLVYMDGANLNAIAGIYDLKKLGVDAVHNNLHKTWSLAHGGGGPGDAIVAVSEQLADFLPGYQVVKEGNQYILITMPQSIGSIHRHFGNATHKVRTYTYLLSLGTDGIKKMSSVAVLCSRYLLHHLSKLFRVLPDSKLDRMHEFILTLTDDEFKKLEEIGLNKHKAITQLGKLFLDFGMHAPTVAFPHELGIMIEPTESYSKTELDRFIDIMTYIKKIITDHPKVLLNVPFFTPVAKVDEVLANRELILFDNNLQLTSPSPTYYEIDPSITYQKLITETEVLE